MPGLSQYRQQGMNPQPDDNANLDAMLQNIDSGSMVPGTMGQSREAMPQPAAQGSNPWLQWLMQYLQSKQPQGQPR